MPIRAPLYLPKLTDLAATRRFLGKCVATPGGCWAWAGHLSRKGYGQFWYGRRAHWAHRLSYAIFVAEIPEGMTPDHTCGLRCCVNPAHLQLVTVSENSRLQWQRKSCPARTATYTAASKEPRT